MTPEAVVTVGKALIGAIPIILDLIRRGRDPESIRIGELVSDDALAVLRRAASKARAFVEDGS